MDADEECCGILHGEPPDGFSCRQHNAYGLMNDDCGILIFEGKRSVVGGRWSVEEVGLGRRAPPTLALRVRCDVFGNFLLRALTIHADGDKWADHGGSALPSFLLFKIFILLSRPFA